MTNTTPVPLEPRVPFEPHEHIEAMEPPVIEADEMFENDPLRDRTLPKRRLARERVLQILYAYESVVVRSTSSSGT